MGVVRVNLLSVLAGLGLAATGCMHGQHHDYFGTPPIPHNTNAHIQVPPEGAVPREMAKITKQGDAQEASEVYFDKKLQSHHGGVVLHDGHLYGFSNIEQR